MAMVKKTNLRKTGGRKSTTLIQSPAVKRIHSRPVTLQGWLQKRGSDGLMLWKKRWFVLSDYCLFYYKDPEEETLLGSFVLASWIISPCTHKDKVYKKYSFKAEHSNMRTYYFAADNDVIMAQWLKALTMASLLQESPRLTSKINNSQMNQLRPKEHNIHRSQQPPVGYHYGFHSSGRVVSADNQPLYVNAPPKPKRLNDGSTPDPTEEESRMLMYHEGTSSGYYNNGPMVPVPGPYVPGPPGMNGSHNLNNVVPRANVVANSYQPPPTAASHYECLRTSYTLNQGPHPPRPRSVDFLEYENKLPHNVQNPSGPKLITLPRRPKSSMSISAPKDEPMDSTAWSEESYAKKMRESAMYVRADNDNSTASIRTASSQHDRDLVSPSNENIDVSNSSAVLIQQNKDLTRGEPDPNLFKRSASARLPEITKPASDPYGRDTYNASVTPDSKKVQQREESMKRLLEWKQRMLQSPLTQKPSLDSPNFTEMNNVQQTPPRHPDVNSGSTLHHINPSKHDIERRDLLEIRSQSVPISEVEHPYDMGQVNYNSYAYQGPSKRMELRGAEDVGDVDTTERIVTKRKNDPESSKQLYSALSFDYPPADQSPYSAKHSSGNQVNYYVDSCEPGYAGSGKSKVPNGFPSSREGTLHRNSNSLKKTSKGVPVNETDEEWGLKLDESSVIKEFSYHYIKNDEVEGHSPSSQSLDAPNHKCTNRRQALQKQSTMQSPITMPLNFSAHEANEAPIFTKEDAQPSPSRNKPLPVGILKNIKSRKKLDLEPTMDTNTRKARWNQPYLAEIHDKRQVFSDTETLLYETSSEAEDREKTCMSSKFANVSSDDDRDEEVAAVLAKEQKTHVGLPEPSVKSPVKVRPASSGFYSTSQESSAGRAHLSISCENITELPEENYMPMTPRKRTVCASPLKDESTMMSPVNRVENETLLGIEECPYVEMTQSGNSKAASMPGNLDASGRLNSDPKYFNSPTSLVESRRAPYEATYNDIPGQEPLYMEVSNVESKSQEYQNQLHSSSKADEEDGEDEDAREGHAAVSSTLPDILNTTAPSLLHHGSRRSDSSDADDEASKDLDSIDAPRHPRFSLSDTFRPASYYLGSSLSERAIIALNSSDHHDSSDSDLVSPPPIPACSPPLDDLDTSIDSTINNKELGLINSKEDFHQTLPTDDKFRYGCISKNNLQAPSSHNETGSSEEESVKSVRTRHFMKRRPLSADILNSLSDFNILNSSGEVKDPIHYDLYERNETNINQNLRSYNTAAVSPLTVPTSDKYNPYRKNGLNSRSKPSYDWGQPTCIRNSYYEANLPNDLKDMQAPLNVSISSDKKYGENCMIDTQPYDLPSSARAHLVSYDVSPLPPSVSQDSAYANSAMLAQESQNNAPYYYSDLFKVDSRNSLNRMGKPDEQLVFDKNNLIRSYSEDGSIITTRNNYPEHGANSSADTHMYSEKMKYVQDTPPGSQKAFVKSDHFPDEMRIESHRRARSLEGLLDSRGLTGANFRVAQMNADYGMAVSKHRPPPAVPSSGYNTPMLMPQRPYHPDGEWQGGSRRAVRHARSLEELDRKGDHPATDLPSSSHHEVVYANSDFSRKGHEISDQRVSAEKEREKIRQWDLMSSAPSTLGQEIPPYRDNLAQKIVANNPAHSSTKPEVLQPVIPIDENQKANWELKFSAGDLLGRTHEELVLLLIQLRRQRAAVCKSMERCHREIEAHACLTDFDSINRLEHIQKLDELKSRLIELEKQYEKGKPLVNLVDNMVKLGSLYQSGPQSVPSEKLEFNHKVQEQRILADERRDWERIRADHQELQAKVEQLYRLDKLLQEESGTLHSLQEDKGVLERALGGLKSKLQGIHGNTAETEWYRRQQRLLERELSRVRSILALNSKKLEETVAENARLEQELVVLRQKLQLSRRTAEPGGAATAALESELCRVQLLVGNLLRQRQELSAQVRQLTEKSNSLSQQIWPSLPDNLGISTISKKKHSNSGWIETDLDMSGIASPANEDGCSSTKDRTMSPLYVNTSNTDKQHCCYGEHAGYQEDCLDEMSPLNARSPDPYRSDLEDDGSKKACAGSNWREKPQEIKTVRIVKRESERRQRDRDHRSGNIGIPLTCNSKRVIPEEVTLVPISEKQCVDSPREESCPPAEPSEPPPTPGPRSDSVHAVWNIVRKNKLKGNILGGGPIENFEPPDFNVESPQLSPVYLSEAARKIVEEVAWQGRGEKRLIPRERRRHHTVSGLSLNPPKHLYSQKGSRDDLDMERVLRPRLTTPDVVRSTLNRTDTSFTKETIDNILGAPGKIVIPERYIPESQPQLSKEEIIKRSKKADAIRKMLCETAPTVAPKEGELKERPHSVKHQAEEEKRNREHLLQLSQILAQEVMEKSKIVAGVNSPLPQD